MCSSNKLLIEIICLQLELYPSNTVVYDGDTDVTLDCEHGELDCVLETVHWIYINESNNITIATNNQTSDEVDAHKYEIVGEYNLVIKNITMEDGGKYFCYCDVVLGDADIYYADLIVLGMLNIRFPVSLLQHFYDSYKIILRYI